MGKIALVDGPVSWVAIVTPAEKNWSAVLLIDVSPNVQRKKRFFNLGWDGERLAGGGELKSLTTHHPEIAAAIAAKLCSMVSIEDAGAELER
jgi:hypothetical protein